MEGNVFDLMLTRRLGLVHGTCWPPDVVAIPPDIIRIPPADLSLHLDLAQDINLDVCLDWDAGFGHDVDVSEWLLPADNFQPRQIHR
jgi:hypothetical protein